MNPSLPALLVGLATAGLVFAMGDLALTARRGNRLDRVLGSYVRAFPSLETAAGMPVRRRLLTRPASTRVARFLKATDERLAAAGISLPADRYLLAVALSSVCIGLLLAVLSAWPLGLLAGAGLSRFLSVGLLNARIRARQNKFADELPQLLALVASALKSGIAFPVAVSTAANQDTGEAGRQLRRALAEVQFGSTLNEALRRVAERMESDDLRWLVLALEIHRDLGGSLLSVLESVVETIRVRTQLRREIRVISSEGRLSGWVLMALPIVSFAALAVLRPSYVAYFWTNPTGWLLLALAVGLMAAGVVWMNRLVRINA